MSRDADLAFLRLHLDWGVDEALEEAPVDRSTPTVTRPTVPADPSIAGGAPRGAPTRAAPRSGAAGGAAPVRSDAAAAAALADAASDVVALEAAIAGFDRCSLRDTAGALAFADGPPDGRVMVVIDAPSAEDDAAGRPLSGALGRLFDRVLRSVAIERASCRIATLVPWRPPGDRAASAAENACCLPFLLAHLRLVRPSLLIVAGPAAARALAGGAGSTRALLGTVRPVAVDGLPEDLPTLFLPPPAKLLTEARDRRLSWEALLALRANSDRLPPSCFTNT